MTDSIPDHFALETNDSKSNDWRGDITSFKRDNPIEFPLSIDHPPILARELLALALIVVICDMTIYRGNGFAGYAALFIILPTLLLLGLVNRKPDTSCRVTGTFLLLTALRLVWCGSNAAVIAGFAVLCGFAMGLSGLRPYVMQAVVFAAHLVAAGHRGLHHYGKSLSRYSPNILRANWIAILLPAATAVVFGVIFLLANPDLVTSVNSGMKWFIESIDRWLERVEGPELLFCAVVTWIGVGLLRPDMKQVAAEDDAPRPTPPTSNAPLYDAFRNTLIMLIGLFAVYLAFEFRTLWFRAFPKGFHYSGYAHEGAAWLTVALGLATLMLSMIFRGQILADVRLEYLRKLAWVWSVENLLLAVSVFNRLFIYVGFNGMTRMRVIGFLGVASVVFGFLLVLWKIRQNHGFVWLIRRQLWTVSFAAYLYAVMPVDAFVNQYNVRRILGGDSAPSVQISVHPTSAEGYLELAPLIDCKDELVRRGIRAMLSNRLYEAQTRIETRLNLGWTAYQLAEDRLMRQLQEICPQWENDEDHDRRATALEEFRRYAYQWY